MTTLDQTAPARAGLMVKAAPWLIAILFLIVMPLIFNNRSSITIMNQMAITIVFALAYNMLLGQGGMLSFGHAVYMGLGGFLCMHVLNWMEDGLIALPLPLIPLLGGLFGMGFALIIGSFSTRKAGTVFAMISLGIGELIAACSIIIVAFFGGEEGITGDRTYGIPVFGYEFLSQIEVYYLTAFWLVLSAFLMYLFTQTPVGRMANAVRDNPERAEFVGYSQRWVRFYSFLFSGFFAGVAGGLFAINYEILTEENLNLVQSGTILLVAFVGGVGFFLGPVIGAIVFTLLQTVLGLQTELWAFYLGILFLATVMFFPAGLTGLLAMHIPPIRHGKLGLLAMPYVKTLIPGALAVLACAALVEMAEHARKGHGEAEMTLYWITFDSHGLLPWILAGVIAVGGIWLAARGAPELRDAFDEANTPEGAR